MTFEQTNEKQRQRMKADARSHKATARTILAGPLYARLRGGEDLYTVVWALWESLAGTGLSNMTAGAVCHACKTHDLDQLDWALTSIAKTGSIRPYSTPHQTPIALHQLRQGMQAARRHRDPLQTMQGKPPKKKNKTMNNLDKYIHRCRLNLEPHHLQPADETDDKHCIICDISGARRHIRMDGLCINCWLKWRRKHDPAYRKRVNDYQHRWQQEHPDEFRAMKRRYEHKKRAKEQA